MPVKIGIPQSLAYFTYFPLWHTFFHELGLDVVTSNQSNKEILDEGVKETVNDACIPIKIYHGHVKDLKDRVDLLFLPRIVSLDGKETVCPKFLGLPDMVRYSIDGLPTILDDRLDLKKKFGYWRFFYRTAKKLDKNFGEIWKAYRRAWSIFHVYNQLLLQEYQPREAWRLIQDENFKTQKDLAQHPGFTQASKKKPDHNITVALLGYPYTIHDPYISVGLLDRVKNYNVHVLTKDNIPGNELLRQRKKMVKETFWYYSNQVIRAALYYLEKPRVDGLIHITAFGCGPDAMVDKYVELECKNAGIPFLTLTLDEHTGEAGVSTRIEAFVDMLKRKR